MEMSCGNFKYISPVEWLILDLIKEVSLNLPPKKMTDGRFIFGKKKETFDQKKEERILFHE